MGISEGYRINTPDASTSLLIATQASAYKDQVSKIITDELKGMDLFVEVLDITQLDCKKHNEYDAYIFLHTWEMYKVPEALSQFLNNCKVEKNSFFISTSGDGNLILEGVDGITSASVLLDAEKDANKALEWLRLQLDRAWCQMKEN